MNRYNYLMLQPLFDIVARIHADTDLELCFNVTSMESKLHPNNNFKCISWWVGPATSPEYGDGSDFIKVSDINEDKLNAWTDQLEYLYRDALGLCSDQIQAEEDANQFEESLDDIADYENRRIDSQERES